jgi:type 1 glutamine amidotransferase
MRRFAVFVLLCAPAFAAGKLAIIYDQADDPPFIVSCCRPESELLAAKLKGLTGMDSDVVSPATMSKNLQPYAAVFVYTHLTIPEETESALIAYTKAGGKLIVIHHGISRSKLKNKNWLPFLGITLGVPTVQGGTYTNLTNVNFEVVNLAPGNWVTTHEVNWDMKVSYKRSSAPSAKEEELPATHLDQSELFLGHNLLPSPKKELLLGYKLIGPETGKLHMVDTMAWHERVEDGQVYYFMFGHYGYDWENKALMQVVANAVLSK